ncbi:hypothetical protein [Corynebacterium ulcerans]|uniref:hypothetical protein n=1 Tax=Corynebacterium ulcerans TaxID=65058 RepID=UPI001F52D31E|nr:hypothetical protein [Corynebacterium ulcerans]
MHLPSSASAGATLVATPVAGATSRVEGQCDEVNHVLLPVETSWGFAKHAEVGDTIGYVMTITNTFFEEGKTKIGVAVHENPKIDGAPDTTKKIDIKPITNDGNGKYLNQNDFASIRYTYTVTEEDIQKQEVTKKLAFPISKGDASETICTVHFEHTQNLKSPFRTYAPWVAGALAIRSYLVLLQGPTAAALPLTVVSSYSRSIQAQPLGGVTSFYIQPTNRPNRVATSILKP